MDRKNGGSNHRWRHRTLMALAILLAPLSPTAAEPVRFGLREAAPLVHQGSDGRLQGVEYEILTQVLATAGLQLVPYLGANDRLAAAAGGESLGGYAPVVGAPPADMHLTDSYFTYRNVAMVRADSGIVLSSVADLRLYRVLAFQRASLTLGPAYAAAVAMAPLYREEPKQARQAAGLLFGRYDVLIGDTRILNHHIGQLVGAGEVPGTGTAVREYALFAPNPYCAAFRDPDHVARFNAALAKLRRDGTYDAILTRHDTGL